MKKIVNHSRLFASVDDRRCDFPHHGFDIAIFDDGSLEMFHSGHTGSAPVYRSHLNPADDAGLPIIMLQMNDPHVTKVLLVDTANSAPPQHIVHDQCLLPDGSASIALTYVRGKGGVVAPVIVPEKHLHRVMEVSPHVTGTLAAPRQVLSIFDTEYPGSFDARFTHELSRTPLKPRTSWGVWRHEFADRMVADRAETAQDIADLRKAVALIAAGLRNPLERSVINHMPADTLIANGVNGPTRVGVMVDGDDWVVEQRAAQRANG